MNALLQAIKLGDIKRTFSLLSQTKNLNEQNPAGLTALHFACLRGDVKIVEMLLFAGANPNLLMTNSENIDEDIEPDSNLVWDNDVTLQTIQHLKDLGNYSPLHIAVRDRRLDVSRLLLEHGADVNVEDFGKCTPLHWAANNGDCLIVELLINYGARINVQDLAESTPLHEAVRKNDIQVVKKLLAEGADPYMKDIGWQSPFDLAEESPEILKILLSWSNIKSNDGPFH